MTVLSRRISIAPIHLWLAFLVLLILVGLIGGFIVFTQGLVVTNLTDLVPWGLWITIDLSAIALSAGAFLLCAAVYLLGLKQFQPVAKTATFIGLIGYSMAVMTLLLDIGRPDRFWHSLVYWNTHSVLWEVTMCVVLYLSVLMLETTPIIGNASWMRSRWPNMSARLSGLHRYAPYLALVGLGLSMLHQSSLGAAYGTLNARPLWYKPGLSILFMVSAMAGGTSLTVLITMIIGRLSPKVRVNDQILEKLTIFIGWVLVGYLYFRFWEALSMSYTYQPGRTEGLSLLTKGPLAFNFWVGEILLGAVIPIILLLVPKFRKNMTARMIAVMMVVGGVVAYRWDVNISGLLVLLNYLPQEIATRYTVYRPSLIEFMAGGGVIAYGALAITLGARYLNIVDHSTVHESALEKEPELAGTD